MKIVGQKNIKTDEAFMDEVAKRSGENVFLCYQCRKCASGCPTRMFMDSTPTELMRYVQLGMVDEAMKTNTIWYCLSCQTCSTRCPQDIDIAHVVDTIRILVQEKKIKADTKNMRLFNRLWMNILKYTGRMYELALTGMLNLFTGRPFKDLSLGIKMIRKGKLKLLPSIRKPFAMMKMFSRAKRLKK
ncbi:MAG: 4Fe-4S dicluster domain-containing protein [Planctomycetota bacterium]|jgi:heterodisulfide reductase subunit C